MCVFAVEFRTDFMIKIPRRGSIFKGQGSLFNIFGLSVKKNSSLQRQQNLNHRPFTKQMQCCAEIKIIE